MRKIRIRLLAITTILIAMGVVMIYSSSAIFAFEKYNDSAYYLKRHLVFLSVGLLAGVFFLSFDYTKLRKFIKPFLITSLTLLVLVLIPGIGNATGSARRWIALPFMNFQPSEIAKVALIFYSADLLSRKQIDIKDFFYGFMPLMIVLLVTLFLVLLEPDLGTTVAIGAIIFQWRLSQARRSSILQGFVCPQFL